MTYLIYYDLLQSLKSCGYFEQHFCASTKTMIFGFY